MENYAQFLNTKTLEIGGTVVDSSERHVLNIVQDIQSLILNHPKQYSS